MTAALLREFMPYGASELQQAARPHMVRALALGSLFATLAFVLAWGLSAVWGPRPGDARVRMQVDRDLVELAPPPPPAFRPAPPEPAPLVLPAKTGVPEPVPDPVAPPDASMANHIETPTTAGGGTTTTGARTEVAIPPSDEPVNRPGTFAPVDQLPAPVT